MKTIIHVRDSCGLYGAERVILTLGKNLNRAKYKILLVDISSGADGDELQSAAQKIGFQLSRVPIARKFDFKAVAKIRSIIKKTNAVILHGHDFKSNFHLILASLFTGAALVVTSHGATKESFKKKFYLFIDVFIFYRFFDRIVAVSERIARGLGKARIPSKYIELIPNGIDTSIIDDDKCTITQKDIFSQKFNGYTFGIVGRLSHDKGHSHFIEAFHKVLRKYPDCRAVFVGEGAYREELEKQIIKDNLQNNIYLCGARSDMNRVYSMIDCIVIPSLREGLPYVLLEAMSKKIPVIATSVGDIPNLIIDGCTGHLIDSGDIEALARCMVKNIEDPDRSMQMASRGLEVIENGYTSATMARRYECVYDALIEKAV